MSPRCAVPGRGPWSDDGSARRRDRRSSDRKGCPDACRESRNCQLGHRLRSSISVGRLVYENSALSLDATARLIERSSKRRRCAVRQRRQRRTIASSCFNRRARFAAAAFRMGHTATCRSSARVKCARPALVRPFACDDRHVGERREAPTSIFERSIMALKRPLPYPPLLAREGRGVSPPKLAPCHRAASNMRPKMARMNRDFAFGRQLG
jgi:hypothetical protein